MQNSSAIKISSLPIGFYACLATHEISTKYGPTNILSLQNKRSGDYVDVFANNNLNTYIKKNPGQMFSFFCQGPKSFSADGRVIEYVKISDFSPLRDIDLYDSQRCPTPEVKVA